MKNYFHICFPLEEMFLDLPPQTGALPISHFLANIFPHFSYSTHFLLRFLTEFYEK